MKGLLLFLSIIILVFALTSCYQEQETYNLTDDDVINFVMVDGTNISTDEYNELCPQMLGVYEELYLYYLSDNPELPGHQGGKDLYRIQYVFDEEAFSTEIENLNSSFPELNTENDIAAFQCANATDGLVVFYNEYIDQSDADLYLADANGILNISEINSLTDVYYIQQVLKITQNIAVLLTFTNGFPAVFVVNTNNGQIFEQFEFSGLRSRMENISAIGMRIVQQELTSGTVGFMITHIKDEKTKLAWINLDGELINIYLSHLPNKAGGMSVGTDGRLYFHALGPGDNYDLYRYKVPFRMRIEYFSGSGNYLPDEFLSGDFTIPGLYDETAPILTVDSISGDVLYTYSSNVKITGTASDSGTGIRGVGIIIDEDEIKAVSTDDDYATWQYNITLPSPGSYQIIIKAADFNGNQSTVVFSIDYQAASSILFVDGTNSGGSGTITDPYETIAQALSATTGQEIRIAEGTYVEYISIIADGSTFTVSGSFDHEFNLASIIDTPTIISQPLGSSFPVVEILAPLAELTFRNLQFVHQGPSIGSDNTVVNITSSATDSNIAFEYCKVKRLLTDTVETTWSLINIAGGSQVLIQNCGITFTGSNELFMDGSLINLGIDIDMIRIENSTLLISVPLNISGGLLKYIYGEFIGATGYPNLVIVNNEFLWGNNLSPMIDNIYGIYISNYSNGYAMISDNVFKAQDWANQYNPYYHYGINIYASPATIDIYRNVFAGFKAQYSVYQIYLMDSDDIRIHDNLMLVNHQIAACEQANIYIDSSGPEVYYNTIVNEGSYSTDAGITIAGSSESKPTFYIIGNIIYKTSGSTGYGVREFDESCKPGGFENNLIFGFETLYYATLYSPFILDLANTNAYFGTDTNISVSPALDSEYHIANSKSPVVDAGPLLSSIPDIQRVDLEGDVRPGDNSWDLGCYEDF